MHLIAQIRPLTGCRCFWLCQYKKEARSVFSFQQRSQKGHKMSEVKPVLLRLRASTIEMLKAELELSAHRSQSSLADELLVRQLESIQRSRHIQTTMDHQAGRG